MMPDHAADGAQNPSVHGCLAGSEHDRAMPDIDLLSPLTIRGVTLRNRIVMSPMCQYIAEGHSPNQAAKGLKNANPSLTLTRASQFVGVARATYCAQQD